MKVYVYNYHALKDGRTIVNGIRYKRSDTGYKPVPVTYCSDAFTEHVPYMVIPYVLDMSYDTDKKKYTCKGVNKK